MYVIIHNVSWFVIFKEVVWWRLELEKMDKHITNAEWWWRGNIPEGIKLEDYYLE